MTSEIDEIKAQNEEILKLLKKNAPKHEDVLTVTQWIEDSSIEPKTRSNRKFTLGLWAKSAGYQVEDTGTGRWKLVYSNEKVIKASNALLEEIRSGRLTVYTSVRQFLDFIRPKYKPYWVKISRSILLGFLKSCLGQSSYSEAVMNTQAPIGNSFVTTEKGVPTREEFKRMLQLATPQYRAFLGFGSLSGWRPEEIVSRKISDLTELPWGGAKFKLQASETKKKYTRYAFLTKEALKWIHDYHKTLERPSDWLFPGERGAHLDVSTSYVAIKDLFRQAGLSDSGDGTEIFSQSSFRIFADSHLSKCGMDRKYIAMIIGHKSKLQSEASYKDWEAVEEQFKNLCETKLTWLTDKIEVVKEIVDPVARRQNELLLSILEANGLLTPELLKSLARTKDKGKITEFMKEEIEKLLLESGRPDDQGVSEASGDKSDNSINP